MKSIKTHIMRLVDNKIIQSNSSRVDDIYFIPKQKLLLVVLNSEIDKAHVNIFKIVLSSNQSIKNLINDLFKVSDYNVDIVISENESLQYNITPSNISKFRRSIMTLHSLIDNTYKIDTEFKKNTNTLREITSQLSSFKNKYEVKAYLRMRSDIFSDDTLVGKIIDTTYKQLFAMDDITLDDISDETIEKILELIETEFYHIQRKDRDAREVLYEIMKSDKDIRKFVISIIRTFKDIGLVKVQDKKRNIKGEESTSEDVVEEVVKTTPKKRGRRGGGRK